VVMYQLINGRPPFSGESYAELVLKVGLEPPMPIQVPLPTGLGEVIMRCLEKDPALRHQTVGDLARMLAPYATDPMMASQSAGRAARILQQRGSQGMQGSPFNAGGGLAAPIPISPAQLTPRSWPPSQGSSLSQGAGQMTARTRGNRAWLIGSVAGLCLLAGGGGYAISQMSKADHHPDEPHVMAPLSRPAADPPPPPPGPAAAPSSTAPSPSPPSPTTASPTTASPTTASPTTPAAATAAAAATSPPATAAAPATDTRPAADTRPATDSRPAAAVGAPDSTQPWRPIPPAPTFPDHAKPGGTRPPEVKSADPRSGTRTAKPDTDGKPASPRLIDSKQPEAKAAEAKAAESKATETKAARTSDKAAAKTSDTKASGRSDTKAVKSSDAKSSDAKTSDTKASDGKAGTKSATKPKPKPSDDLFDNRH
jgi:hypothetical protein